MKTLFAATVIAAALSSTAFAGDLGGKPCASAESASYQAAPDTSSGVIVRPDGGGLGADPDVGVLAMAPVDPATLAETSGH